MTLTQLQKVSDLEKTQILNVLLSAFASQHRLKREELKTYFYKKIVPRLEQGHLVFVAIEDCQIVGFSIFEKCLEEGSYYLAEMAVDPEHQRKGFGRKLVTVIFEKDRLVNQIVLVTEIVNSQAREFYQKIGFKPSTFQHPDYSKDLFTGYELCVKAAKTKK